MNGTYKKSVSGTSWFRCTGVIVILSAESQSPCERYFSRLITTFANHVCFLVTSVHESCRASTTISGTTLRVCKVWLLSHVHSRGLYLTSSGRLTDTPTKMLNYSPHVGVISFNRTGQFAIRHQLSEPYERPHSNSVGIDAWLIYQNYEIPLKLFICTLRSQERCW